MLLLPLATLLTCDWITGPGNQAPQAVGRIPDQIVEVDGAVDVDVAPYFSDLDGDSLRYWAVSAVPATAAVTVARSMLTITGVAAGETMVTVTAQDPDTLTAMQRFSVTVPNRAPVVTDTIPHGEVFVDDALVIDLAAHFVDPDGDGLEYAATSSDTTRAMVSLSESEISVTGMAVGAATVTVTARDPGGLEAEQSFGVTVPNRAPVAVGTIEDRVLEVDSMAVIDVAPFFADPDRDSLVYAVMSSDSGRVTVSLAGSSLVLGGVAKGDAAVIVTARDPGGLEAGQTFGVTVPNRAPAALGTIGDVEVYVGDGAEIDIAAHFTDPDGDALEYAVVSSDTGRVVVTVSGGMVTVTGAAVGNAVVKVVARDSEGLSAEQEFGVTVPNRAPEPFGTIADRDVYVGDTVVVNVAAYFVEPDGEVLVYAVESSSGVTATVGVSGSTVVVGGVAVGQVVVTVTARDPHGVEAEQRFVATVPNRAPVAVGTIGDRVLEVDSVAALDVAPFFTDPDRETLVYAALSSDSGRVTVSLAGSVLALAGLAKGDAAVTVTARDPGGLEVGQSFGVTVPNRAPAALGTIGDVEVYVWEGVEVDIAAHFTDPDGDALEYAVVSSDTGRVVVDVTGGMVRVAGAAVGDAVVTVIARDPEGLVAEQAFGVTVPNRAPEPFGTIADRDVYVGDTVVVAAAAHFTEPDGEALAYTVESSSGVTATVGVSGGTVVVGGEAVGEAVVTVTARDPHGVEAEQRFGVTVPNRAPVAVGTIGDRVLEVDSVATIDVAPFFMDPDRETLVYAALSSDSGRVTVSLAGSVLALGGVAKGDVAVTVTVSDPGGLEAGQSFLVMVPNRAPVALGGIEDLEVYVGEWTEIDVAAHFTDPDGDSLEYAVVSSDTGRVVMDVTGGTVRVTGAAVGDAVVKVIARDPEGLVAEQEFGVTMPNRAPEPFGTIADRDVHVGDTVAVDVAAYFTEPDGELLVYTVESSSGATATVGVSGSMVVVRGVAVGEAVVTVTARDPHGVWAEQRFVATVPNRAPVAVGSIADRVLEVDSVARLDVAALFAEPDGETLDYVTASSDTARVAVGMTGSALTVTGVAAGSATVTVTAHDPGGLEASASFVVTVPNRAPVTTGGIADRVVRAGDSATVDLAVYFADPDGDALLYSTSSSDTSRATATVMDRVLTVTGVAGGSATISVAARDSAGLFASQSFLVTVPNRAPDAAGTIRSRTVERNRSFSLDLSPYFSDPDGDALTYSATSSNATRATVTVSGSTITVAARRAGTVTITVTATDPGGLLATQSFRVRVVQGNRTPRPVGTIPDASVQPTNSLTVNVSQYFRDPDGDDLEFDATSSSPAVATASVSGTTLTVSGVEEGGATITVTATDPGGLTGTQRFEVTVEPTPPSDLVVEPPRANPNVVEPGGSFTLNAAVLNRGAGSASSGTTLRYYRSQDATISNGDTQVGTDEVGQLGAAGRSSQSHVVTAPSTQGTYYYGACVDAVGNESNTGNNCSSAVEVEVGPANQPPHPVGTIPDDTVDVDEPESLDVESYFTDPDGDDLTYTAGSSNSSVLSPTVSGSSIALTGWAEGEVTVTVTATDPGGLAASQSFKATVVDPPNQAPVRSVAIDDIVNANSAETYRTNLQEVFTDPDDDVLSWWASSSDEDVAWAWLHDNTLGVNARAAGTATVTVTATDSGGLSAADTFEVTVVPNRFDIDLYATSDFTESQLSKIGEAIDRWEAILASTELANTTLYHRSLCLLNDVSYPVTIDDHAVRIDISEIDGPGGLAALAYFCETRSWDGTPIASAVFFDEADMFRTEAAGDLFDLAFHEFAHGLGFTGNYFRSHALLDTVADPHFKGTSAIAAFNSAGGTGYPGAKVPLASGYSHWHESVFGIETMTPIINFAGENPISAITIQAMADLGYTVDVSQADHYELSDTAWSDVGADQAGEVWDLTGDLLQVPVRVIAADGRVVRVVPAPAGWVLPRSSGPAVLIDRRRGGEKGAWVRVR